MTAPVPPPVPYESRVRPLIAAAQEKEFLPIIDLATLTIKSSVACADLAEAVRDASAVHCKVGMRCYVEIDADEWSRIVAALARLDAAGGA